MSALRVLASRVAALFSRRRREAELTEEIRAHLDALADEFVRRGMAPDAALAAARRDFGGVVQTKEAYRDRQTFPFLDITVSELRYAARSLGRSPGFACVAALTLALGIGPNTALFSLVYGVLMRPLDYRDADRLVAFKVERDFAGRPRPVPANFSLGDLDVWQARGHSFEQVAMVSSGSALMSADRGNEVIGVATVTRSFFSSVGGRFVLGRGLGPADDESPTVVISRGLWQRAFSGTPTILGKTIVLDRQPYAIAGVADSSFQLPTARVDVWRPIGFARQRNPSMALPRAGGFQLLARLRSGVTIAQARGEAASIGTAVDANLHVTAIPLRDLFLTAPVRPTLLALSAAVGLVLFVACANVTNLILARNTSRSRDIAVRLALGASRGRLAVQSILYSAMIGAAGASTGTLMAMWLVAAFVGLAPAGIPRLDAVHLDLPVLLFATALGITTSLMVGILPAFQSFDVAARLKTGSTVIGDGRFPHARRVLVVAQLAVCVVLLVGAALLGQSLAHLLKTDLGVTPDRVTSALVDLSFGRTLAMSEQRTLIERIVQRVQSLPGVASVGAGASMPPNLSRLRFTMNRFDGAIGQPSNYMVDAVTATPGYFSTLGIRLQKGRFFSEADTSDAPQTMIMTASTTRRIFGDVDPLGHTLGLPMLTSKGTDHGEVTLVGIIDDVKYSGLDAPSDAVIYRPFAQQPWPSMFIVARLANDDPGFPATFRRAITAVDPAVGILSIDSLDSLVANSAAPSRFRAVVLAAVAALAIGLAAVGLYGVIAYGVAQRTRELGIRMALGATPRETIRLVLGEGLWLAAAGVAVGAVAARAFSRAIGSLLFGIQANDALSYAAAIVVLLAVAIIASYLPARRASRVDPLIALRTE